MTLWCTLSSFDCHYCFLYQVRMQRLFIPLLIGILLIVPPQHFFQYRSELGSYWDEFPKLALSFESNHLWFIEFLIVFVLLAIPVDKLLKMQTGSVFLGGLKRLVQKPWGLFLLVIPLIIIRVVTKRYFDDSGGLENLSRSLYYFYYFVAGMIFYGQFGGQWRLYYHGLHQSFYWAMARNSFK